MVAGPVLVGHGIGIFVGIEAGDAQHITRAERPLAQLIAGENAAGGDVEEGELRADWHVQPLGILPDAADGGQHGVRILIGELAHQLEVLADDAGVEGELPQLAEAVLRHGDLRLLLLDTAEKDQHGVGVGRV